MLVGVDSRCTLFNLDTDYYNRGMCVYLVYKHTITYTLYSDSNTYFTILEYHQYILNKKIASGFNKNSGKEINGPILCQINR